MPDSTKSTVPDLKTLLLSPGARTDALVPPRQGGWRAPPRVEQAGVEPPAA